MTFIGTAGWTRHSQPRRQHQSGSNVSDVDRRGDARGLELPIRKAREAGQRRGKGHCLEGDPLLQAVKLSHMADGDHEEVLYMYLSTVLSGGWPTFFVRRRMAIGR